MGGRASRPANADRKVVRAAERFRRSMPRPRHDARFARTSAQQNVFALRDHPERRARRLRWIEPANPSSEFTGSSLTTHAATAKKAIGDAVMRHLLLVR
jgi:hypothetical protein